MDYETESYNESCPICFEKLVAIKETVKLECKHSYCYSCFVEMYSHSLNESNTEINGECCYCRSPFIYTVSLKDDFQLIIKEVMNKLLIGILKYAILMFFTFCLIIHGTSFIQELTRPRYKNNFLMIKEMNCISYVLFIVNQMFIYNSVVILFDDLTRQWIYKIPAYIILYTFSISLLYMNAVFNLSINY